MRKLSPGETTGVFIALSRLHDRPHQGGHNNITSHNNGGRAARGNGDGGAGSRVPGGCARAGGLSWGGVRGRARVAAVRIVSHIPAGPRFLY